MGILDGIVEWIAKQVMNGLDLISTSVLGALGCDMGTFLRYFPAADTGCTIVATGKLENFTRDGINAKIISLGATPGSSITKKTDYLICGEKAGSKLAKAQQLGIKILTEQEFLDMIAS